MRRGFLWASLVAILLGLFNLYYFGYITELPFLNTSSSFIAPRETVPLISEGKIDALVNLVESFPKNEAHLKRVKVNLSELKDPFSLEAKAPEEKVEVRVNQEGGLVVEIPPPIKLEGVVDVGSKKLAILQIGDERGIILAQGEKRGDIRVIKVERGKVVVAWKNQIKFLELEESR